MNRPAPGAAWLAALRADADRPPDRPRVPLWAGEARIGSVEPDFFDLIGPQALDGSSAPVQRVQRAGQHGWQVAGELTASLHALAGVLRGAGLAHVWRDEQLPVTDEQGRCLGTVERAVVRPLGITTFAVHLAGRSPDGRHWVQQRSRSKPNDPGLWDTLMGGMVPATDSLAQALERETWEEAGLKLEQLEQLRHGGHVTIRRPTKDGRAGYVVERIDWYRCVVPAGITPVNQDGEVEQFELLASDAMIGRLERSEFTLEAALILTRSGL